MLFGPPLSFTKMYVCLLLLKAAVLQMLKNIFLKINGKYWSSYVQWRNLLLLTPYSVDKIVGKTLFFFA